MDKLYPTNNKGYPTTADGWSQVGDKLSADDPIDSVTKAAIKKDPYTYDENGTARTPADRKKAREADEATKAKKK